MIHLAKVLRPSLLLAIVSGLFSCDQAGTAPAPPPPGRDTLSAPLGDNDVLQRADLLEVEPSWVSVRPIAPAGQLRGVAWYALDLDSGHTYRLTLRDSSFLDVSLSLYHADSSLLRTSTSGMDASGNHVHELQFECSRTERVYLVVQGPVPSLLALHLEILPGQDPGPDAYERMESGSESRGGPSLSPDSQWINRTLHRGAGGEMESGDFLQLSLDSGKLYTLHLQVRGNEPSLEFLPWGMLPIDTVRTRTSSKNTVVSQLTFPAWRTGMAYLLVRPSGPGFKPVAYRLAATRRDGIPDRIYPDLHEPDDTPASASLLVQEAIPQVRTLHRDGSRSDVDEILLIPPSDDDFLVELHDSLHALSVEAFLADSTPLALSETVTGSVRSFLVPGHHDAPVRLRLSDRLGAGVRYLLKLRAR